MYLNGALDGCGTEMGWATTFKLFILIYNGVKQHFWKSKAPSKKIHSVMVLKWTKI